MIIGLDSINRFMPLSIYQLMIYPIQNILLEFNIEYKQITPIKKIELRNELVQIEPIIYSPIYHS